MNKGQIKKILIIGLLALLFLNFFTIKKYSFNVDKSGEFNINSPLTFKITSKYYGKKKSLGDIDVKLYNKHNNNSKMETTLKPYLEGSYEFIYVPKDPGQYFLSINYTPQDGSEMININQEFTVK